MKAGWGIVGFLFHGCRHYPVPRREEETNSRQTERESARERARERERERERERAEQGDECRLVAWCHPKAAAGIQLCRLFCIIFIRPRQLRSSAHVTANRARIAMRLKSIAASCRGTAGSPATVLALSSKFGVLAGAAALQHTEFRRAASRIRGHLLQCRQHGPFPFWGDFKMISPWCRG